MTDMLFTGAAINTNCITGRRNLMSLKTRLIPKHEDDYWRHWTISEDFN